MVNIICPQTPVPGTVCYVKSIRDW